MAENFLSSGMKICSAEDWVYNLAHHDGQDRFSVSTLQFLSAPQIVLHFRVVSIT